MNAEALVGERATAWRWTFDDPVVTQLRVDYRLTLLLGCGATIAISEPFELVDRQQAFRVPPGDSAHEVAAALPLFNQRVASAEALESGELVSASRAEWWSASP